jgi:uncharacterized protein
MVNKKKIVNDPVYGFINIPTELLYDLIEHPYFQRLRRIKQLGLTHFVYPAAHHTRFQHALGAMYLTGEAISVLRSKEHDITPDEAEAVMIAILLHDIGHGPFSHALEHTIAGQLSHEELSLLFMHELNRQFDNRLEMAIAVFENKYPKRFLYQLVSGQLDMDRLDYLRRDSFFTGVTEGVIGSDRIIKMLNIVDDNLVVDAKGIYSVEKFLIARRLMYWQVYLHKTVIAAEQLLLKILHRAKKLAGQGEDLFGPPWLRYFLYAPGEPAASELLEQFARLDDNDIVTSAKVWMDHPDPILSTLCKQLLHRELFRIELQNEPFAEEYIMEKTMEFRSASGLDEQDARYFVFTDHISNNLYNTGDEEIKILTNRGVLVDIGQASDILNFPVLSKTVTKYFLCYPKKNTIHWR